MKTKGNTIESFLTEIQTSEVLSYCKNTLTLEDGKLNISDSSSVRKSKVAFTKLDGFDFLTGLLLKEVNRNYKFDGYQIDTDITYQFTEYQEGEFYDWHTDSGNTPNAKRRISVVILLNDDYEEGDLVLKIDGEERIMDKKTGNLFLFDSSILHKVNPVKSGTRCSLVTWIKLKETDDYVKRLI